MALHSNFETGAKNRTSCFCSGVKCFYTTCSHFLKQVFSVGYPVCGCGLCVDKSKAMEGRLLDSAAVPQSFGRWSEAGNELLDLRRDLRVVNEEQRSVIPKELAPQPLAARTELKFIGPDSLGVERQAHGLILAPGLSLPSRVIGAIKHKLMILAQEDSAASIGIPDIFAAEPHKVTL
jgi:hypothetical protein